MKFALFSLVIISLTAGAAIAETVKINQEVAVHSYKDARAALIAKDYTTAVSILEPLAKNGDADAQNALGFLYANGLGVERDYDEALRWYQKAVSQEHVKAQANLGALYADGKGVEQDYAKAASLFLSSAKQGYTTAQIRLGGLYDKGLGVQRDYSKAAKWYRKAAEQGDATAQGLLGAMYAKGEGIEQNYSLAMMWYRKSAEQGHPLSQYNLGHMYEHGEGVVADKVEAQKWYQMAAKKGHPGAKTRLAVLTNSKQGVAPSPPTLDKEATQTNALEAPPADLAQGYLAAKASLDGLEKLVKSGAFSGSGAKFMLKSRGEIVNKDNVDEHLTKYQKQLSLYEDTIKQRGYANIAGAYTGEATKSCANSRSLLATAIQQKVQTGVEIKQEGIDAQIVIGLKQNDKDMSIGNPAAIAETAIAVIDAMNSDYYFRGEIKDQVIVLKPDVSVLSTWPKWASPPSRNDLEDCTVTLERM